MVQFASSCPSYATQADQQVRSGQLRSQLLAHLLSRNTAWRSCPIRTLRVIENDAGRDDVEKHLSELIETSRINATGHVIVAEDVPGAILHRSRFAALVFMGLESREESDGKTFPARLAKWAGDLPRVVFVDSAGGMSLDS